MKTRIALAAVTVALLASAGAVQADDTPKRTITGTIAAAARISVDDGNGDVHVIGDDGSDVRYTARVFTRTDAAANAVSVEQVRDGDRVRLSVRFPEQSRGGWWFQHSGVSVDLEVRVPRGSGADVRSGNGDVHIGGVRGNVRGSSGNGGVDIDGAGGDVYARSGNGDVAIALPGGWHGSAVVATSGHGDVRLEVPRSVALRYRARTGMGDVKTPPSAAGGATATLTSGMGDVTVTTR